MFIFSTSSLQAFITEFIKNIFLGQVHHQIQNSIDTATKGQYAFQLHELVIPFAYVWAICCMHRGMLLIMGSVPKNQALCFIAVCGDTIWDSYFCVLLRKRKDNRLDFPAAVGHIWFIISHLILGQGFRVVLNAWSPYMRVSMADIPWLS